VRRGRLYTALVVGAVSAGLLATLTLSATAGAAGVGRLPSPVYRTVAVAAHGTIYVLGGHDTAGATITSVDAFDPAHGRARLAGHLALPTHGAAAANLGGRILVFGGASSTVHDVVQQFLPASGRSRVVGTMPTVRADVTAVVVGRRAILVGGFDGAGPQSAVWATPDGRHVTVVAHLRQPVRYPAVAAAGSDVYVFGGLISGGEYTGTFTSAIQRIDLRHGTARIVGRLPTPLAHAMAADVNGRLYVLGGSAPGGPSDAIRAFDPAADTTHPAGRLPRPLTDAAVATIGSTVYLLGGISAAPLETITIAHPHG
jgi:N-acetylneuraminic acid mutarotase